MDDILKYHRIQGRIQEILQSGDKISTSYLENSTLLLGTESGYVHICNLGGSSAGNNGIAGTGTLVHSLKCHDRSVNSISSDSNGIHIASCSDDGSVYIYTPNGSQEEREHIVNFSDPLKVICMEEGDGADGVAGHGQQKKEKSFIVGTATGQLIYHKTSWFAPKNTSLFGGSGSPVCAIAWRGAIVAWADLSHVRLLDVSTQSAICFLDCPIGVNLQCPIPCKLFWDTAQDLWIGWADQCRHLQLNYTNNNFNNIVAKSVKQWQTDCIVCGIASFDAEHMVVLGYIPPDEDIISGKSDFISDASSAPVAGDVSSSAPGTPTGGPSKSLSAELDEESKVEPPKAVNYPELQIIHKTTGKVVSVDVLPMKGELIMSGPWGYELLSTNNARIGHHTNITSNANSNDAKMWNINNLVNSNTRGGARGYTPVTFIISPQDIVVARVRDVNDRICIALVNNDLVAAANLAVANPYSLTHYKCHDLVSLYVEDLIDQEEYTLAASECARLIDKNVGLWELWICAFIRHRCIQHLLKLIPVKDPVLGVSYYEMILQEFVKERDSANLYAAVELWERVVPHVFDHSQLLIRLENYRDPDTWVLEARGKLLLRAGKVRTAQASLYFILPSLMVDDLQLEEAVLCYLSIKNPRGMPREATGPTSPPSSSGVLSSVSSEVDLTLHPYFHVFDIIEKKVRNSNGP
jgi:WD40 repeat protein